MNTDLHAPLELKRTPASKSEKRTPVGKYAFGVFCIAAMIGLNAATNQFLDPKPATEIVTIAEPSVEVEQVTASISEPASPQPVIQNGVEVVYGTPSAPQLNEQPNLSPLTNNAPVPERRPDGSSERSLSPGGPKIITLAPSSPSLGQPIEVAHLPEDAALEDFGEGMVLPRISEDGRRPMDIYARPWSQGSGKRIAIMIGGIGLSQTSSQAAIEKLPPEITLGFSPAGNSLNRWMRAARKKGHELIVQVPMEPFNYPQVNPGPKTLRLASTAETNIERLHASLASITNYTGVSNYLGARFMTSADATNPIFREVGQRGLLFFNDGTAKAPRLAVNAEALGVPYVEADIVIDASRSPSEIQARLKALEDLANTRGVAIGSGSALGVTIETVATWANEAKKRGFEIVGISALAN